MPGLSERPRLRLALAVWVVGVVQASETPVLKILVAHVPQSLRLAGLPIVSPMPASSPRLVGSHAGESLRTEKANRHWGHEMGYCDTPLEAGLMFACKLDKPNGFVGREALIQRREDGADGIVYRFDIHMQGDRETVFFDA